MNRFVVLLRGINVSGQKLLPMKVLRETLSSAGFRNVKTYIQSGNIILDTEHDQHETSQKVKNLIYEKWVYDVPVTALTHDDLKRAVNQSPFKESDSRSLYVTFFTDQPESEGIKDLEKLKLEKEEFSFEERWMYLLIEKGYRNSKFNNNFVERKLKTTATTRNWRTVNKLLSMAET